MRGENSAEEKRLVSRMEDLAVLCEKRCCACFSEFLDEGQQALAASLPVPADVRLAWFGGYEGAQRSMAAFYPSFLDVPGGFPIAAVEIRLKRLADGVSHRDYLGSLLSLDIRREKLGDLLVYPDHCVAFVEEKLAPFLCENLTKVKNEGVCVSALEGEITPPVQEMREIRGTVQSLRADSVVALACRISREKAQRLLVGGFIGINHRPAVQPSQPVAAGDILSIRGHGRYRLETIAGTTKKGRISIVIQQYL